VSCGKDLIAGGGHRQIESASVFETGYRCSDEVGYQ
jgi:hypothetical protein